MAVERTGKKRDDETPLFIRPSDPADPFLTHDTSGYLLHSAPHEPLSEDETQPFRLQAVLDEEPPQDPWIRFGEWLLRRGLITNKMLFAALHEAFLQQCRLGDALVQGEHLERVLIEEEASLFKAFLTFQDHPPATVQSPFSPDHHDIDKA